MLRKGSLFFTIFCLLLSPYLTNLSNNIKVSPHFIKPFQIKFTYHIFIFNPYPHLYTQASQFPFSLFMYKFTCCHCYSRCESQLNLIDSRKRLSISISSNGSDYDYAQATMAVISLYIGQITITIDNIPVLSLSHHNLLHPGVELQIFWFWASQGDCCRKISKHWIATYRASRF